MRKECGWRLSRGRKSLPTSHENETAKEKELKSLADSAPSLTACQAKSQLNLRVNRGVFACPRLAPASRLDQRLPRPAVNAALNAVVADRPCGVLESESEGICERHRQPFHRLSR